MRANHKWKTLARIERFHSTSIRKPVNNFLLVLPLQQRGCTNHTLWSAHRTYQRWWCTSQQKIHVQFCIREDEKGCLPVFLCSTEFYLHPWYNNNSLLIIIHLKSELQSCQGGCMLPQWDFRQK